MKIVCATLLLTASALCFLRFSTTVAQEASQIPDPNFNTRVERPAYTKKRPRVMFDEAHFNVHTTETGYKAFAEMMANDGYQITPDKEKFNRNTLKGFQILVIANALGAASPDDPDAARPAFTGEESDAVRDWVRGGGALLLITDHERQVEISAANRAQGVALKYGKGRVVVTGEAGMLSAQILKEGQASYPFGMNVPGFDNRQLALNIMHWLSGLLG